MPAPLRPPIRSSPDPTSRGASARDPRRRHPCRRLPAPPNRAPDDGGRKAYLSPRDGSVHRRSALGGVLLGSKNCTKRESRGDHQIYLTILIVVALCSAPPWG